MVHVGSVNVVDYNTSQTQQQEPSNNMYELHGEALDVCSQIMTDSVVSETEPYTVKVTRRALDDHGGASFETMTLVPDSTSITVSNGDRFC